jgi:translation initiation factor 1
METLRMRIEKQGRGGKTVTVIDGFTRRAEELEDLVRELKRSCGTGGTVRGGRIEVQGDARERVRVLLSDLGFTVKG